MLSDSYIKSLKSKDSDYTILDSNNLHLLVTSKGSKLWRCRFTFKGQKRLMSVGSYPQVSLQDARKARDLVLVQISKNIDPVLKKNHTKSDQCTLHHISLEWLKNKTVSKGTHGNLTGILTHHIYPWFKDRLLAEISTQEIIEHCRTRETTLIGRRVLSVFQNVYRYARSLNVVEVNPVSDVKGLLQAHKHIHHPSIIDSHCSNIDDCKKAIGKLLRDILNYRGSIQVRYALLILAHVFVRPDELRNMKWEDIDFQEKIWCFNSTKTSTQHIVPLSPYVIGLLRELEHIRKPNKGYKPNNEYVFPHKFKSNEPVNDYALGWALAYKLGYKNIHVPHGFRALARTLLDEELHYPTDIIELQLAHKTPGSMGRTYNRSTHLMARKEMMSAWSEFLLDAMSR